MWNESLSREDQLYIPQMIDQVVLFSKLLTFVPFFLVFFLFSSYSPGSCYTIRNCHQSRYRDSDSLLIDKLSGATQDQGADLGMTYGQVKVESVPVRAAMQQHLMHQTQIGHPVQTASLSSVSVQPQRSFSSSEEERSTPECASDELDELEKGK